MRTELIMSTYNAPRSLRLTLRSILLQDRLPDGVAIADDGSGEETRQMLDAFRSEFPHLPIRHVWHEDQGFRKTIILNKAIVSSQAEYLVFTDGDCLLPPHYVSRHLSLARRDRYCCGSLVRLSAQATADVTEEDVAQGRVFTKAWLSRAGAVNSLSRKLKAGAAGPAIGDLLEHLSPVRRTFCGANASAFREALLAVNGYDETMVWGGEDKELGIRLGNSGVQGRHLRYTASVLHLDHPKGYIDPDRVCAQREMIKTSRRSRKTWTESGIRTGA